MQKFRLYIFFSLLFSVISAAGAAQAQLAYPAPYYPGYTPRTCSPMSVVFSPSEYSVLSGTVYLTFKVNYNQNIFCIQPYVTSCNWVMQGGSANKTYNNNEGLFNTTLMENGSYSMNVYCNFDDGKILKYTSWYEVSNSVAAAPTPPISYSPSQPNIPSQPNVPNNNNSTNQNSNQAVFRITLIDRKTKAKIKDAELTYVSTKGNQKVTTDREGTAQVSFAKGEKVAVNIKAKGYVETSTKVYKLTKDTTVIMKLASRN